MFPQLDERDIHDECLQKADRSGPMTVPLFASSRASLPYDRCSCRGAGGQVVVVRGGPQAAVNSGCHPVSQGQLLGRCSTIFRAEVETRAGMLMSLRRMVPLRALPSPPLARVPMARVRLNAIVASTSQAAFAVKIPEGRCASALFFRSALTCSMIACWRCVLSAVIVSRSLVVKNAWNRSV